MSEPILELRQLKKQYGDLVAVDNISLQLFPGEIFGLLGPNGAGKTTTVEMIEGLRIPDAGNIRLFGENIPENLAKVKSRLGVQLQVTQLPDLLRVDEILQLFASYYAHPQDVGSILNQIQLKEKRRAFIKDLSGGQKQRLALALALIPDPDLLILDEPTTGLDPQARRQTWQILKELRGQGKTILLTTHYMEEAEFLCDRVAVIDHGRFIAIGSPRDLIAEQNLATAIEFELDGEPPEFLDTRLVEVEDWHKEENRYTLFTRSPERVLTLLVRKLDSGELPVRQISVRRATLEDVFLELTGRKLRE